MVRVRHIVPLLLISSCSGNQWSEVDAWAAQEPGARLVGNNSNGRVYAEPYLGQYGGGAVPASFIVVLFKSADATPIRWIIDFDCEQRTAAAFSSEIAKGTIKRDWLGDPITAQGRPFRLAYEGPMDPEQVQDYCKSDWSKERAQVQAALERMRSAARDD
jgi:hypothetical protein